MNLDSDLWRNAVKNADPNIKVRKKNKIKENQAFSFFTRKDPVIKKRIIKKIIVNLVQKDFEINPFSKNRFLIFLPS